ncbi:DUF4369 domain-containing protein [Aureisphaera galaxeae]|uniref:DUF4369 domain-containing protein n=1 Tax=Aureisphaera galaxeae TaxID=1538023 RepID=UPI002350422C|nr:DUF4369 domain-containing protein [Aureisphaera galaxeae]MDC8004514.1 DUF4369 domain-containing protein [Aureisphaera galaxeae]
MKYFLSIPLLCLLLSSCGGTVENQMTLTGEIKGLKKGSLYLQKLEDTLFISLDSMEVDGNSQFEFSAQVDSPEIHYLTLTFADSSNTVKRIPFFAEAKAMTVATDLNQYEIEASVNGSTNHEKLEQYLTLLERYQNKKLDLIEQGLNALKEGNDSLVNVIQTQQEKLLMSRYLATVNYALNQAEYEVAPYLMLTEAYDANIKYLDTIYGALSPKIKDSKYGKELESFIQDRKQQENK